MPNNPWSDFFLQPAAYPGSSGYVTGQQGPSIYGTSWDPITRTVRSNNPDRPGYDQFGRLNTVQFPSSPNASGVNPYQALLGYNPAQILAGGYSQVPLPGTGGSNPGQVAPRQLLSGTTATGGYNPSAPPGQGYNPFFTVNNVKSPDIQSQIGDLTSRLDTLKGQDPTSMIQAAMAAQDPNYAKYLSQETGAVGGWYNGDVQNQLDALRAQRAAAYQGATSRALGNLSRVLALNQMGQGGAAAPGTSSYLQKQALDTAANLQVQSALDQATQGRSDLMTLLGGQQQNLGTRAGLTTSDITRQPLPSQLSAQWFNQILGGLGGLSQLNLGNNFYGLGQAGPGGVSFPGMTSPIGGGGGGVPNSQAIRPYSGGGGGINGGGGQSQMLAQFLQALSQRGGGIPGATSPASAPGSTYNPNLGSPIDYGTYDPTYDSSIDPALAGLLTV